MPIEERKYCLDNCKTILNDNSYQSHRKYCDDCNHKKNIKNQSSWYENNLEKRKESMREYYWKNKKEKQYA